MGATLCAGALNSWIHCSREAIWFQVGRTGDAIVIG
jgi:hypothetical protein